MDHFTLLPAKFSKFVKALYYEQKSRPDLDLRLQDDLYVVHTSKEALF